MPAAAPARSLRRRRPGRPERRAKLTHHLSLHAGALSRLIESQRASGGEQELAHEWVNLARLDRCGELMGAIAPSLVAVDRQPAHEVQLVEAPETLRLEQTRA